MVDRVGQQIGNYRLSRLLGRGGFAEVYLGEHIHLKTLAAVKVLRTQLTKDEAEKFRSEARTLAHLVNPHIVRVLEFGFDSDTPYLIMDYAPNGTLRQLHHKGSTVPLPTIINYVKQIAVALFYAHSNSVIHRDVKPENMLLARQKELLLSDFGIATVAQSSRLSNAQSIAGTAAYMAPEQINGKPRPASDQYALGVVVYEWLVGATPFQGSFAEISTQHLLTSPPALRSRVSTIPYHVEQVVLTALEKDPDRRFRSVQAFANALEQAFFSIQQPAQPVAPDRQPVRRADPPPAPASITPPNALSSQDAGKEAFPNTLPALPKASVSNFWWPTFFVSPEERIAICSGMVPQEHLGVTGVVLPSTSPLLPLPVSISDSQPLTGSLAYIQDRLRPAAPQPAPQQINTPPRAGTSQSGIVRTTRISLPKQPAAAGQTGTAPQVARSTTSTPSTPTKSSKQATWYATTSLTLAALNLILLGIIFIPAIGKFVISWVPWVIFTAPFVAFGFGIAGSQKRISIGKVKTRAGVGIALSVLAILLAIAWLVYYNSYLVHLPVNLP